MADGSGLTVDGGPSDEVVESPAASNGAGRRPVVVAEGPAGGVEVSPSHLGGRGPSAAVDDEPERERPSEVIVEVAPEAVTEAAPDRPDTYPSEVIVEVAPEVVTEAAPDRPSAGRSSRWHPRSSPRWRRTGPTSTRRRASSR